MVHELAYFKPCTFGDGGHYYHDGFDRAVCSCGWKSAASNKHEALVALWKIHKENADDDEEEFLPDSNTFSKEKGTRKRSKRRR